MAWYAIVWREDTSRAFSMNVPNFNTWCIKNVNALKAALPFITEADSLPEELVDSWNRTFGGCVPAFTANGRDRISGVGNEYYARVGILPEHHAPKMEYFGDGDWWWHYADKPDGSPKHRTVLAIAQFDDVAQATKRCEELLEEWSQTVEEYDTDEWNLDRRNMRTQYQEFREWVMQHCGVMPPELEPEPKPVER